MQRSAAASLFAISLAAATGAAALAADQIAFVGPKDWSKVDTGAASTDPARSFNQWKLPGSDPQTVTVIHDTGTTYDQSVAAMNDNFTKNSIKPSVNKDTTCLGRTAHVVEFQIGPDGHQIITNRLVVPDGGTGVITVTYSRAQGYSFDDDVKSAEESFCKGT